MDNAFNQRMRAQLAALREELAAVAATGAAAAQVVELDQSKVGRLSRMDAMQAQAMSQEAVRRREEKLRLVAGALARLDAGNFGLCLSCEEPIASRRLEFDPTAMLCVDCAASRENSSGSLP